MTKLDISSSKTLFLLLINHITTMRENDCIPTDFGSLFKPNRVRIPIKVNNQISNPQGPDPHTINMTGIRYPQLLSLFFHTLSAWGQFLVLGVSAWRCRHINEHRGCGSEPREKYRSGSGSVTLDIRVANQGWGWPDSTLEKMRIRPKTTLKSCWKKGNCSPAILILITFPFMRGKGSLSRKKNTG